MSKHRFVQTFFGLAAVAMILLTTRALAQDRARDLGIPFEGTPGVLNAITDVAGVAVGHATLIKGEGELTVGAGPVRTGVTVVLPRGKDDPRPVYAGFYNLNGNGEMTGQSYLEDYGIAYGPIGISNTNAIGDVYSGIQKWTSRRFGAAIWPVVGETYNDIEGFHVTPDTALQALDAAAGGKVAEGNVGGGTGMRCFGFKGGIGTASRVFQTADGQRYTVGALVQCNTGDRTVLRIAGVPIGAALAERYLSCFDPDMPGQTRQPLCRNGEGGEQTADEGSIIIIVATDAPLNPSQLNRVARRAALGLGRLGSYSGNGSGDLMLAFSTGTNVNDVGERQLEPFVQFPTGHIDAVFKATVEATEEAIVNALITARTMTGINGRRLYGLPHTEVIELMRQYGRID